MLESKVKTAKSFNQHLKRNPFIKMYSRTCHSMQKKILKKPNQNTKLCNEKKKNYRKLKIIFDL